MHLHAANRFPNSPEMFAWRLTRRVFCILAIGVFLQYLLLYIFWAYFGQCADNPARAGDFTHVRRTRAAFTCVFRDFDAQHNDLAALVAALDKHSDIQRIITVSEGQLYPPVKIASKKHFFLELEPSASPVKARMEISHLFTTEWVLLLPTFLAFEIDALNFRAFLREAELVAADIRVFAIKIKGNRLSCHTVRYDHPTWSLHMNSTSGPVCDGVTGSAVYMLKTDDFLSLVQPFAQPVDESLLIQASIKGWTTQILSAETPFSKSSQLLEPTILGRMHESREPQRQKLYARLDVKRTVVNGHEELFGCTKATKRCFGDVINEMPSYIYEKRFTPPCCARALKKTLEHVIDVLNLNGVRYWLEGGSLLGAARNGQLIPWDYDVDLGIYLNDTQLVQYLRASTQRDLSGSWHSRTKAPFFVCSTVRPIGCTWTSFLSSPTTVL
ncbi:ribitol 5-phosphate transferase FKRP-like isoform X1 [Paramacrobiotus metropolitanus]|uniref:ribitol 5-phosphate transferase FKRP-like isoform X1 n=1 Tax=Paramacrobiotus metropolitanus TaxID=2943436 RepID=UPI00244654C6|nr:ribitol 5-phosphate transferase FKRP-like isoform X1 [Paramacrobiotus metropolitanus]